MLETLTGDILKSSEIEGVRLDAEQVGSSVAPRLGMDIGGIKPADRNACYAVSDGPQRNEEDHDRSLARRCAHSRKPTVLSARAIANETISALESDGGEGGIRTPGRL